MGAAVVRVKGTPRALAVSVDGNGRYCYLDPYRGAALAVAEAARNVACAGRPADWRHQLPELRQSRAARDHVAVRRSAVDGIAEACRALDIPITGGNVSFYNETDGFASLSDAGARCGRPPRGRRPRVMRGAFTADGSAVVLLGEIPGRARRQRVPQGRARSRPRRAARARSGRRTRAAAAPGRRGCARSAALGPRLLGRRPGRHAGRMLLRDGRASASKSTVPRAVATRSAGARAAAATLFGESASRAVVSVAADRTGELLELRGGRRACRPAASAHTGGRRIRIAVVDERRRSTCRLAEAERALV